MVTIIEKEYCSKCDKYMKYDLKGKCIKCGTLIYKTQKEYNSYNNLSKEDDKTLQGASHLTYTEW